MVTDGGQPVAVGQVVACRQHLAHFGRPADRHCTRGRVVRTRQVHAQVGVGRGFAIAHGEGEALAGIGPESLNSRIIGRKAIGTCAGVHT